MAKLRITDLLTYRWRYIIGYAVIGVLLVASLLFAGLLVPGGLTEHEMAATVTSASIDINNLEGLVVADLPYHLLQLLSINLLGVSILSVKLPSLILGLLTAVGLIFLLRRWFRYNVALLAAVIIVATSQFLFLAQNGTPLIMHLFWPVWLLLSATMIAHSAKPVMAWRFIFFILAALSLYTPLSIYILVAITAAVMLHPHLRYLFWRIPTGDIVFSAVTASLILIPLGYEIVMNPEFALTLLGFSTIETAVMPNLINIAGQVFNFSNASLTESGMMLPILSLGSILLALLGVVSVARFRHSVKTYLLVIWILLMSPVIVNNPTYLTIALLPMIFLLASGLNFLFQYWYGLFPKNPYARVAGLIPLVVLVGGLVVSGLDRYSHGYTYSSAAASTFSDDISLVNSEIRSANEPLTVVVSESEYEFYVVTAEKSSDNTDISVSVPSSSKGKVMIAGSEHDEAPAGKELDKILTNGNSNNADRFYIYKNPRT